MSVHQSILRQVEILRLTCCRDKRIHIRQLGPAVLQKPGRTTRASDICGLDGAPHRPSPSTASTEAERKHEMEAAEDWLIEEYNDQSLLLSPTLYCMAQYFDDPQCKDVLQYSEVRT